MPHFIYQQKLTIEEYKNILAECDKEKSHLVNQMIDTALSIIEMAKSRNYKIMDAIPEIRIVHDPLPDGESNSFVMYINSGAIDHCLKHSKEENYFPKAGLSFGWILAHEFIHAARKHTCPNLIEIIGNDDVTFKALEYDADLCAIAAVFRYTEKYLSNSLTDIEIRIHVLKSIFTSIRCLPNNEKSSGHPRNEERLYDMLGKLALLPSINDVRDVDVNCSRPDTTARHKILCDIICECEESFLKENPEFQVEKNLIHYLYEYSIKDAFQGLRPVIIRWDEIRSVIGMESKSRA